MQDKNKPDFVNVVARIRPNIYDECSNCLHINTNHPGITIQDRQQSYLLDHVFDEAADQETVYENTVKPLVDKLMLGYNCTVFAYGQTGSGKTYTMGTEGQNSSSNRGIIIRTIYDIMNRYRFDNRVETNINVSFCEIYNEKVYDLLSVNAKQTVPLKVKGFLIQDLTKKSINNFIDGCNYLQQGAEQRHRGETKQNATSSRSHAIFTIYVNVKNENTEFNVKLNLVDLAGSESAKRTCAEGSQFEEGVNINLGLLSIGQVISALSKGVNNNHIPYRESVITTVLKDSLNRNNYITLIVCISANSVDISDTAQALDFAQRVKKLKSKPELSLILEQATPSKTTGRPLLSSNKRYQPRSNLSYRTPLKRQLPFSTSTSFNLHRPLKKGLSTPSIPLSRVLKTTVSSLNMSTVRGAAALCSTFLSDVNADSSMLSSTSKVVSSQLDITVLSPVIRKYLENVHKDAMSKLDYAIREKINATVSDIIKMREVSQATAEVNNQRSPKNIRIISEDSPIPNQYSTFVENMTPNRTAPRTNLEEIFDSPPKLTNNVQNNSALFKIPKLVPRKHKLLPEAQSTKAIENESLNEVSPTKRRRSIRLQQKNIFENSVVNMSHDFNGTSKNLSDSKQSANQILNRRRSVRLSVKLQKLSPKVAKKNQRKSKKALFPEPSQTTVVSAADSNYNRILLILNYGTEKQLMELSSVGMKTARQIHLYRSIKGKFGEISDLSTLPWKGNGYQRFLDGNFLEIEGK